ncbi:hypothetical protein D3C85_1193360 [compost metagenome]
MRAADHQPRTVIAGNVGRSWRSRALLPLQTIRHAQQILIGERTSKQRHAPRQTVAHETARHGDGGVVEQVHEVGVIAQFGVAQDRFGFEFCQGDRAANGRREHAIESIQSFVAQGFQRLQPILGTEGLHAGDGRCLGQYGANHRQHGLGILFHQFASDAVALGHPWSFVKQACRFKKGRKVQFHCFATQALELIDRITEQQRSFSATEKRQVLCAGHAEAEWTRCAERRAVIPQRIAAAVRVPWVESGGQCQ